MEGLVMSLMSRKTKRRIGRSLYKVARVIDGTISFIVKERLFVAMLIGTTVATTVTTAKIIDWVFPKDPVGVVSTFSNEVFADDMFGDELDMPFVDKVGIPDSVAENDNAIIDANFDNSNISSVSEYLGVSNVPNNEEGCKSYCKTWMRASAVTAKASGQWKLLHSEKCRQDETTKIMMYEDRYCIAVGSYYANQIGTLIDVTMESGEVLHCIVADQKADVHTDETNRYHTMDGSVIEFVVGPDFTGVQSYPSEVKGNIHRLDVVGMIEGFVWG